MAGLVAGAFSMATGEYISVTTQNEAIGAEVAVEESALKNDREAEITELADSYIARGVSRDTATAFATELADCPEQALLVRVQEELGVEVHAGGPELLPGLCPQRSERRISHADLPEDRSGVTDLRQVTQRHNADDTTIVDHRQPS